MEKCGGKRSPCRRQDFPTTLACRKFSAKGYDAGLADFRVTQALKGELADYWKWYDSTELGGVISQIYLQIEQERF